MLEGGGSQGKTIHKTQNTIHMENDPNPPPNIWQNSKAYHKSDVIIG